MKDTKPRRAHRQLKNPRPSYLDPEVLDRAVRNAEARLRARALILDKFDEEIKSAPDSAQPLPTSLIGRIDALKMKAARNRPELLSSEVLDRVVLEQKEFFLGLSKDKES